MTEIQNLIKQGKFDEAAELAKKEYERTQNEKILNLYGIALFKKGDFKKSAEIFEKLYAKYPENPKLLINYASSLIEVGDIDKAERLLRENAMIFPEEEKIYELIEECQRRKKEMKKKEEGKDKEVKAEKEVVEGEKEEEIPLEQLIKREEEVKDELESMIENIEEIKSEWMSTQTESTKESIEFEEEKKISEEKKDRGEESAVKRKWGEFEEEDKKEEKGEIEDEERISLEVKEQDTFLRRGRVLEVELRGDEEIIIRETFIVFISGDFKVIPLRLKEEGRIKNEFFGGKNHKFVKIRGTNCKVCAEGEYISVFQVDGTFTIFEQYLLGFTPSLSYDTKILRIKKVGKVRLVELEGNGKAMIFTGGRKVMLKNTNGYTRISLPNFIGATGRPKIKIVHDSVDIDGAEKVIIRI